jgi:diguanylate cyclase (GGDEF)-like protein
MRLIRLAALVGSLVLLVATSVSMLNQRAQQRAEQQALVSSVAVIVSQSVAATVERATAAVGVADAVTDPALLIRTFDGASACIVTSGATRCTAGDHAATEAYGAAVGVSVDREGPAVVVDDATSSIMVVERRNDVTASIQLPGDALVAPSTVAAVEERDVDVDVLVSSDAPAAAAPAGSQPITAGLQGQRFGPSDEGDRVAVVDTITLPGDGGSVRVTAAVADEAGLFGDRFAEYAILLALGTVLAALAGWTFLVDRRTLERRATTDDLTNLPNRREFERITDEALLAAERFNTGLCVMLIDLNGFKQINDTLGHQFGDLVLRAAATRLTGAVRETDVVGRWGGDEFVVLLPGVEDGSGVRASAERIGAGLAASPIAGDVTVTAAIGAALFPMHGTTLDELIRAADEAMYGAKTTGVTHRLADVHRFQPSPERTPYGGPDRRRHSDRV